MNYYKTNYSLTKYKGITDTELDNKIPWERELLITQILNDIKEQEQKIKNKQYELF